LGVARPPREELAGGIFHVYARGNRGQPIYFDDADRQSYLSLLAGTARHQGWHCLAYCLMDNHVHLMVETPEPNLARGMQQLHGSHAMRLNKRYGLAGHAFQGRYGSVRILSDEHLWVTARYIALNPVEAGLCESPDDYEWSSHSLVVRGSTPAFLADRRLLSHFDGPDDPLARYRRFVGYAALPKGSDPLGRA
jgi:REP element-mobilizing transposase RayT